MKLLQSIYNLLFGVGNYDKAIDAELTKIVCEERKRDKDASPNFEKVILSKLTTTIQPKIMKQEAIFKIIGLPVILFATIYLIVYITTVG
jgi:hypothetical protein